MEPVILALSGALVSAAFGLGGAFMGARRGRERARAEAQPRLDALEREVRRSSSRVEEAERRGRLAGEHLRAAAVAPLLAAAAPPTYPGRPSPREIDAIAARLRGFAFLEGVVVADAAGLALSRDETLSARELAALVPRVAALETGPGGALDDIVEVILVTRDARHAALRRLPAWTGGAFLGAMARSQPPASLALDAAVAGAILARSAEATRDRGRVEPRLPSPLQGAHSIVGGDRGANTKQLLGELERMTATTGARALALGLGGQVICGVFNDGPAESVGAALLARLDAFTAGAARALRDEIVRVEITLGDRSVVVFAPLQAASRFALLAVTTGRALDALEVDRLIGRIRRLLPPPPSGLAKTAILSDTAGSAS